MSLEAPLSKHYRYVEELFTNALQCQKRDKQIRRSCLSEAARKVDKSMRQLNGSIFRITSTASSRWRRQIRSGAVISLCLGAGPMVLLGHGVGSVRSPGRELSILATRRC